MENSLLEVSRKGVQDSERLGYSKIAIHCTADYQIFLFVI